LQEGLKWVSGGKEFKVYEAECIGMGDEACVLHVVKEPIG
jgi:predicted hydrocarbon binding protein